MIKTEELHSELMISKKNDELTPSAKDLLFKMVDEIMDDWYEINGKFSRLPKEELKKSGEEYVFKYWRNFNGERSLNPKPYFKEVFKRGLSKSMQKILHQQSE